MDCVEKLVKYVIAMPPYLDLFADRFSEREERCIGKQTTSKARLMVSESRLTTLEQEGQFKWHVNLN